MKTACPHCGFPNTYVPTLVGTDVKCAECRQTFTMRFAGRGPAMSLDGSHQRQLATVAAVLLCVGVVVFVAALFSGRQSNIFTSCTLGLVVALAGFLAAIPAHRTMLAKIVIGIGLAVLVVGGAILLLCMTLAAGFSEMR